MGSIAGGFLTGCSVILHEARFANASCRDNQDAHIMDSRLRNRAQHMTIYVDADACPVKAEIERVGTRHQLRIKIVSNGGIRPSANPLIDTVIVAEGADEADKWIAERVGPGDIVVTGDIPLASKCVEAGAQVLKHNGDVMSTENIGNILATRDLMADLRAADPFRQGSGRSFSKADRSRFLDALERAVRRAAR